jgi:hypothetical protein
MATIFIPIAACKEKFLIQTINSATRNAKYPSRVFFGIFNTIIDEEDSIINDQVLENKNILYMEGKFPVPLGTGLSRLNASVLFDREHDYIFQIDAHTIFEKNWDHTLIQHYQNLLKICDKPIISYCAQGWVNNENNDVMLSDFAGEYEKVNPYNLDRKNIKTDSIKNIETRSLSLLYDAGSGIYKIDPIPYEWKENEEYVEHSLIMAGSMFSSFKLNNEIIHDPYQPWDGDQLNFSLRAWTRGYRMFSIKKSVTWSHNIFIKDVDYNGNNLNQDSWRTVLENNKNNYFLGTQYGEKIKKQYHQFIGNDFSYWGASDYEKRKEFFNKFDVDFDKTIWKI